MSNPFYNYSGAFIAGTLARAEAEAAEFTSVQTGFSLLVTQGVDSGVVNAYVVTTLGQPTVAYVDGTTVEFKPLVTNTGASTLSVNAIPAANLLRFNGAALVGGDLITGVWATATYNSLLGAFTLTGPGQTAVIPGSISTAPPTHLVGLTAAGGSSIQAAPIDATYAIDQAIVPTWTGVHTFSNKPVMNAGLTVTGSAITSSAGLTVSAGTVALQSGAAVSGSTLTASAGLTVSAGTVALQSGAAVSGSALTASAGLTVSAGSVVIGSPTGAGQGNGTINATGLFVNGVAVVSGTGFVSSITGTANQIAASASTGAVTLSLPQNVIIPTPSSGNALVVNGVAGTAFTNYAAKFVAPNTTSQSNGVLITAGTNASDGSLSVQNAAANTNLLIIFGDGHWAFGLPPSNTPTLQGNSAGAISIAAPSSGTALTVTGLAGNATVLFQSSTTASNAFGPLILGGTNASDFNTRWVNAANSTEYAQIHGDGSLTLAAPTGGAQGLGTINVTGYFLNGVNQFQTGTFTGTLTGLTTSPTASFAYRIAGGICTLVCTSAASGTSNSTSFTITGLPAACQAASSSGGGFIPCGFLTDNSVSNLGGGAIITPSSGTIVLSLSETTLTANRVETLSTAWTSVGTKGITNAWTITYSLS